MLLANEKGIEVNVVIFWHVLEEARLKTTRLSLLGLQLERDGSNKQVSLLMIPGCLEPCPLKMNFLLSCFACLFLSSSKNPSSSLYSSAFPDSVIFKALGWVFSILHQTETQLCGGRGMKHFNLIKIPYAKHNC